MSKKRGRGAKAFKRAAPALLDRAKALAKKGDAAVVAKLAEVSDLLARGEYEAALPLARRAFEARESPGAWFAAYAFATCVGQCAGELSLTEIAQGEKAARQAFESGPPSERQRLTRNLEAYTKHPQRGSWSPLKPLLTLAMIVKDEALTCSPGLASVKPWIDRYIVLDTGSTDATPDVIRTALKWVPGEVHHGPFVDFANAKNRALDLCGVVTEWILFLNAEDVLEGGEVLREWLAAAPLSRVAYALRINMSGTLFSNIRVVRSAARWRFQGAVHEQLCAPGASEIGMPRDAIAVEGARLVHDRTHESHEKNMAAIAVRDVVLLRADFERNPDTHNAFHLARMLFALKKYAQAAAVYDARIAMGGDPDVVFHCMHDVACCALHGGEPEGKMIGLFLAAHEHSPDRADPPFEIATYYLARRDYARALPYARTAYALPFPTRVKAMLVVESIYTWRAALLLALVGLEVPEAREEGYRAALKAARNAPPEMKAAVEGECLAAYERLGAKTP